MGGGGGGKGGGFPYITFEACSHLLGGLLFRSL